MNAVVNNEMLEMFQVEELEERLENCWNGEESQDHGWYDYSGDYHENWVKVPCGTENNNDPWRYVKGGKEE